MKKINIHKNNNGKNSNEICLGNGRRILFKSNRLAKRFVADTNRFLTKCLVVINYSYVDILREYRMMWFVGTNNNAGRRTNYTSLEQKIKTHLQSCEFVLDKFNATWHGSNDPFFAFIDLRKAALFLDEAAQVLYTFYKSRNNTAAMYTCQMLRDRCKNVIIKLDEYDVTVQP